MGAGRVRKIWHELLSFGARVSGFSEQFISFLIVGGVNTVFYYALYSLFLFVGFPYGAAAGLATCIGVLFNFQSFGRLVFGDRDIRRLGRFIGVYVITWVVNVAGLKALESAGIPDKYIAGLITVLPVALLAFYLNRRFVFNRQEKD